MGDNEERAGEDGRPLHPMGVVSDRTGLTPDVIRVWERRYGVVEPGRDAAGNRLYTDADVSRLDLLARAVEGGRSIGRIAELSEGELADLVKADATARWRASIRDATGPTDRVEADEAAAAFVDVAMERTRGLDAAGLEAVLERAAMLLGVRVFLEWVVAPLQRRIGEEWHAGVLGVAHEHLASGVTVPLLGRLRSRLPTSSNAPLLAVATPSGERHEVGALLAAAVAASEGWRVLYLGPDLPASEIALASTSAGARAVALSVVRSAGSDETAAEIREVAGTLAGKVAVLVGGAGVDALAPDLEGAELTFLDSLGALEDYLRRGIAARR